MAASGSGGAPGRPWTAASTWAPALGSAVEDAVEFETSEDDAEASPSPVVLARPLSDGGEDPPPCEVTVKFTGKYEIHRVYVRSTARIYEIYYSTDPMDTSKDYLCTVRCGLAAKEPLPSVEERMSQTQCSSNAATGEKHEQEMKSVTSSSDEDSWVEVKILESPLENITSELEERNANGTCQKSTLTHYEATAEISDASPCVSLTVRLLSLQSKTSVHIEEIYIFADPVESTDDDSVTGRGNMGGSSLLAMLIPGLMQMPKSKNCKVDGIYISDGLSTQLPEGGGLKASSPCGKIAQEAGLYATNDSKLKSAWLECRLPSTDGDRTSSEKGSQDELPLNDSKSLPVEITENTQMPSAKDQRASNTDQHASPPMNEIFTSHNRMERMLDTLLSKVEKMELYCSRFEDNMMSPLGRIETRLLQLEQQFDLFSVEIQSLRGSPARMSAADDFSDTTNSLDKSHNDGNARASASITNRRTGFVIRAPEFSSADTSHNDGNARTSASITNRRPGLVTRAPEFSSADKPHNDGTARTSTSITNRRPGLVIRAPEFSSEDSCGCDMANENSVTLRGPNVMPSLVVKAPCFICDPELTGENVHYELFPPIDSVLSSEGKRKTSPGLAVKIPEFPNDEDDEVEEEKEAEAGDHDDGHTKSDDTMSKSTVDSSKGKTSVSVDGALASALEAFLTSTKRTSLSNSVACTASNSNAGNIIDSSRCSSFPEQVDEVPAKDGSIGQFSAFGDANKVGTSIPYQGVDVAPHTSLSKVHLADMVEFNEQNIDLNSGKMAFANTQPLNDPSRPHTGSIDDGTSISYQGVDVPPHASLAKAHLVGKVEVNEQNIGINSGKMAFVSTEPLDVLSRPHTGSIDDVTQVNGQNNDNNADTTPFVISTEPMDDPSQPPTLLGSVDGSEVKEEPPTILETVDETPQVNENRTALSLAEFLTARNASSSRNGTSEVCLGTGGAGIPSFKITSAGTGKNSAGGDSTASQENDIFQVLLLKKALEADDDSKVFNDTSVSTNFEASSYVAPSNGANKHCTNATQTVSDEDADLGNTEDIIKLSGGMGSIFFPDPEKICIEKSNLDSVVNESLMEPKMEQSWSDLSSMELFGRPPAREAVSIFEDNTVENYVKELLAATGTSSTVTPILSEELQLVYDCHSIGNITNKSSPSLEVLLGESSDSEAQISDLDDIDSDAGFGSSHLFSTFSSSDDDAFAADEPSVDVRDVDDLTKASDTGAPLVNEPLVDLPEPSKIYYASASDELSASVDDLPKSFDGGSSEHPGSLI